MISTASRHNKVTKAAWSWPTKLHIGMPQGIMPVAEPLQRSIGMSLAMTCIRACYRGTSGWDDHMGSEPRYEWWPSTRQFGQTLHTWPCLFRSFQTRHESRYGNYDGTGQITLCTVLFCSWEHPLCDHSHMGELVQEGATSRWCKQPWKHVMAGARLKGTAALLQVSYSTISVSLINRILSHIDQSNCHSHWSI